MASGLPANWLGSRRDKRGYEHEQEMAREARSQERLDQAYIALGEYLSRFGDWARSMHPFLGPVPAPDPLQPGEPWRIEALVTAYGSEEVQRLLDRWGECAQRIENADVVIRMADESRDPSPELDQDALREKHALEDYRKAMGTRPDTAGAGTWRVSLTCGDAAWTADQPSRTTSSATAPADMRRRLHRVLSAVAVVRVTPVPHARGPGRAGLGRPRTGRRASRLHRAARLPPRCPERHIGLYHCAHDNSSQKMVSLS